MESRQLREAKVQEILEGSEGSLWRQEGEYAQAGIKCTGLAPPSALNPFEQKSYIISLMHSSPLLSVC